MKTPTPEEINAANAELYKARDRQFRELIKKHPHDLSKAARIATKLIRAGFINDPDFSSQTCLEAAMSRMREQEAGHKHLGHARAAAHTKQAEAQQKAEDFVAKVQERRKRNPALKPGQACDQEAKAQGIGKSTGRRYWDRIFPKSAD